MIVSTHNSDTKRIMDTDSDCTRFEIKVRNFGVDRDGGGRAQE